MQSPWIAEYEAWRSFDPWEPWANETQELVLDFVGDDDKLAMQMLDCATRFWERAFDDGLTPQEAFEKLKTILKLK